MDSGEAADAAPPADQLEVIEELLELDGRQLGALLVESGWLARDGVRGSVAEDRRSVLPDWAEPRDLSKVGWGVIFPSGRAGDLRRGLHRLLGQRKLQARHLYQEYEVGPYDPARTFLARHGVAPGGMVKPDQLPYYLLIVGAPTEISFEFQYHLNIHRAVGRLAFDELGDYERYAEGVVEAELEGTGRSRRMTFFSVDNGDAATERLKRYFVQPLRDRLRRRAASWPIEVWAGEEATKAALGRLFEDAPSLLVTASHGLRMEAGSLRQTDRQGALICQDWPGKGWVREDSYFHAGDLPAQARLNGLVAFLAACYGAGTPREDNFPHRKRGTRISEKIEPEGLAEDPFIARLPQALLRQGALAVVGHVDRLWTSSFCWGLHKTVEETTAHLEDAFARLLGGHRIGHALRPLAERSSRLAEELAEPLKWLRDERPVDEADLAKLWTGHNDARNMILLGDPAVKIAAAEAPFDPAGKESTEPAPEPVARVSVPGEPVAEHPAPVPGVERSLRLIVTEKPALEGTKLVFQIEVSPEIEGFGSFESFESKALRRDPIDYFKDFFRDIESMAGADAEEMLASYGVTVYEELIPESLRARLWQIRDQIGTVQIVSYEAWIPWELMKLRSPDGGSVDDRFLAERFALTRWLSVERYAPTPEMPVRRIAAVIPGDSGLRWSHQERQMLQALESSQRSVVEIRPARFANVIDALGSGDYDAWHFSGHGSRWGAGSDRWSIVLEAGDALTADHLSHRARRLGATRPLVFVNTCSSAPGEMRLTCTGGLVAGFLKQGAGAYLGTHWAVPDRQAAFFAQEFYRNYLDGRTTLGEAVRRTRLAVRKEFPGDPTWLAYTIFAHPQAVCGEALSQHPAEFKPDGIEPDAAEPGAAEPQLAAKPEPEPRQTGLEPVEEPRKTTSTQRPQSRGPKMTPNRAVLLAAVVTAVATVIAALLTVWPSPKEHELLVRVADRRSSAGIHGAEVILFVEGGPFRATADSDGAAQLQFHLEGDPSGLLVAQAPGYEIIERTIQPLREKMVYLRLSRRSSETAHALIRVIDGIDRRPVAGAEVLLLLGSDPHIQVTDSHGLVRFQVDFLAGKAAAEISVTTAVYAIEHQRITLLPDKVQDVVLDRQAGTLSGGTGDVPTPMDREEIGQLLLEDGAPMSRGVESSVESKLRKNLGRTLVEAGDEEAATGVGVVVLGPRGQGDSAAAIELTAKLLQSGRAATTLKTGNTELKALMRGELGNLRLPADIGYLLLVEMGELTVGDNPVMSDMKTARLDLAVKIFTADGRPFDAFGVGPAGTGFSEDSAASQARTRAFGELVRQVGERLPGDDGAH